MSHLTLAEIVGHPDRNGIYRVAGNPAVGDAIRLPGPSLAGKPAMMRTLAEAFALPDYFGQNWDALQDCLADLSWLPGAVTVLIEQAEIPAAVAPDAWAVLLDILNDVARYWRGEGRAFCVLLRGGHDAFPLLAG